MNNNNNYHEDESLINRNVVMSTNINTGSNHNNNNNTSNSNDTNVNQNREQNFVNNFISNPREALAQEVMERAGEKLSQSWYEKLKCFNLSFLQVYFDVTTDEIKERLINSLIPFNPKFYDLCCKTPDLYGPFWIFTTLIFIMAASGSFTKYLTGNSTEDFFQEFVPTAASIVF